MTDEPTPSRIREADPELAVEVQCAINFCISAMQASGCPIERSPTVYANLISMTLGQCFKTEDQALKALEALIADLRQMVPAHHKQIAEGRKAMIREKLMKAH